MHARKSLLIAPTSAFSSNNKSWVLSLRHYSVHVQLHTNPILRCCIKTTQRRTFMIVDSSQRATSTAATLESLHCIIVAAYPWISNNATALDDRWVRPTMWNRRFGCCLHSSVKDLDGDRRSPGTFLVFLFFFSKGYCLVMKNPVTKMIGVDFPHFLKRF